MDEDSMVVKGVIGVAAAIATVIIAVVVGYTIQTHDWELHGYRSVVTQTVDYGCDSGPR